MMSSSLVSSLVSQEITVDAAKSALIDYVKANPILWDSNHRQYKDFELKHLLWEDCSNRLLKMGYPCSASDLPKQWKNLVDYYRHLKKKSQHGNYVKWSHFQAMCFLDGDPSTERPNSRRRTTRENSKKRNRKRVENWL
ncbi:hypothetical protein QR680_007272 [Steinernema hermaphroditum]|uniref:MADF domain-containing protein n=1 Tax=Steinernema hermaphroditum TaxID=289476 RepID=A0AA39HY81_9BILA|nr:hypothetical protein QR680_007272 [Steinernema hermaphroditum]